jgi:LPXTG-motif cell wall-anchored protein
VRANELRALLGPARSWPLKAALAAVFAAALPGFYFLHRHGWLLSFNEWIQAQGAAGAVAFAIVYVVSAVLLLAPSELMWIAAGVVFGAWAAPLVLVSSLIESLVVFLLARHVLRPKVRLLLASWPLLRAIDAAIRSESWKVGILLRLNALVPFNFQNYFFGATDIGLVPYTITTFFGVMPFTAMYVYLGTVGRTIAFEEGLGASNISFLLLGLLAMAGLIYLLARKTRQKLDEIRDDGRELHPQPEVTLAPIPQHLSTSPQAKPGHRLRSLGTSSRPMSGHETVL